MVKYVPNILTFSGLFVNMSPRKKGLIKLIVEPVTIILISLLIIISGCAQSSRKDNRKDFYVKDFGAVGDGKTESIEGITAAIETAIRAGAGSRVIFESGIYKVTPTEKVRSFGNYLFCLKIDGAKDLVIEGSGETELIVNHPRTGVFDIENSRNVTVRGLKIDMSPLPFTQGRVVATNTEEGTFDLLIDDGFPVLSDWQFDAAKEIYFRWGTVFDAVEDRPKAGMQDMIMIDSWDGVEGRTWRLNPRQDHRAAVADINVGDRFVHVARNAGQPAVMVFNSEKVTVEDITVYASVCEAVVLQTSKYVTIRGLNIRKRPGTGRLISTDSDGIHCDNSSHLLFENCYMEGMDDDGINIHSRPYVVNEVLSPEKVAVTKAPYNRADVGDTVQIEEPVHGVLLGETKRRCRR